MNKKEFIRSISEKTELPIKQTGDILSVIFETIKKELKENNEVSIIGFGKFETRTRSKRTIKNPANGSKLLLPSRKIPAFKAGKRLKDVIN